MSEGRLNQWAQDSGPRFQTGDFLCCPPETGPQGWAIHEIERVARVAPSGYILEDYSGRTCPRPAETVEGGSWRVPWTEAAQPFRDFSHLAIVSRLGYLGRHWKVGMAGFLRNELRSEGIVPAFTRTTYLLLGRGVEEEWTAAWFETPGACVRHLALEAEWAEAEWRVPDEVSDEPGRISVEVALAVPPWTLWLGLMQGKACFSHDQRRWWRCLSGALRSLLEDRAALRARPDESKWHGPPVQTFAS